MNDPMSTPVPEQPKKSNQGLIIAVVVVVVLCCCCLALGAGYYLWLNGDSLMQGLNGLVSSLA